MKAILSFLIVMGWVAFSGAVSKVPNCEKRPDFLPQGRPLSSLKSLPNLVFVAKSANYYVENKSQSLKIWGQQSFVKGNSQILCASAEDSSRQSFSIYAPTLIDLTGEKSIGDSYWQFHMTKDAKQFGIWNQKSRLFSKSTDLEENLSKIGAQVQVIQISREEYEMVFTRESNQTTEILSIHFETFEKIP